MQFIDLKTQYQRINSKVASKLMAVLDHGRYVMGPEISELETKLAEYTDTKHCIACSSGTDALLMPLMAWGLGPGDAVFTTPFTFISTAEVVSLIGATPVFVDIDEDTFNIDTEKLEKAIKRVNDEGNLHAKAIIPVDLFGLCADYKELERIETQYGLHVLEDAAQSFGAEQNGRKACNFGDAAATSFYPAKPLGCYGDGGAVFTNNDELADKFKSIRVHGMDGGNQYENVRIGINGRMDTFQAAVLLAKMEIFEEEVESRNRVAKYYSENIHSRVKTPFVPENNKSVWAQYSVLAKSAPDRDQLRHKLNENGIPTAVYYPKPLHLQKAFKKYGYKKGDFPVSESVSERIFSLPMHPYLKDEELAHIKITLENS